MNIQIFIVCLLNFKPPCANTPAYLNPLPRDPCYAPYIDLDYHFEGSNRIFWKVSMSSFQPGRHITNISEHATGMVSRRSLGVAIEG